MQLKDAIGAFFLEFAKFETPGIGMTLRALSRDPVFVTHAEQLLDLEARLKLLERMAFAREVPAPLMAELEACLVRARILRDHRDEVARNLAAEGDGPTQRAAVKPRASRRRNADLSRLVELESAWRPAIARVEEYTQEAVALQETLRGIREKLENHVFGAAAAVG